MDSVPMLSTGQPSTLGSYFDLCKAVFGEMSNATLYFEGQIVKAPHGRNEIVEAEESQMMFLIGGMVAEDFKQGGDDGMQK